VNLTLIILQISYNVVLLVSYALFQPTELLYTFTFAVEEVGLPWFALLIIDWFIN
jgi:hypothetical protein